MPLLSFRLVSPIKTKHSTFRPPKSKRSRLGCERSLPNSVQLCRLATAGPVASALRTSRRRLVVRWSTMQYFVRYHTGKGHAIGHGLSRPSLKGVRTNGNSLQIISNPPLCAVKYLMIRPQRYTNIIFKDSVKRAFPRAIDTMLPRGLIQYTKSTWLRGNCRNPLIFCDLSVLRLIYDTRT